MHPFGLRKWQSCHLDKWGIWYPCFIAFDSILNLPCVTRGKHLKVLKIIKLVISCICWSIALRWVASALSLDEYAYLSKLMTVCGVHYLVTLWNWDIASDMPRNIEHCIWHAAQCILVLWRHHLCVYKVAHLVPSLCQVGPVWINHCISTQPAWLQPSSPVVPVYCINCQWYCCVVVSEATYAAECPSLHKIYMFARKDCGKHRKIKLMVVQSGDTFLNWSVLQDSTDLPHACCSPRQRMINLWCGMAASSFYVICSWFACFSANFGSPGSCPILACSGSFWRQHIYIYIYLRDVAHHHVWSQTSRLVHHHVCSQTSVEKPITTA